MTFVENLMRGVAAIESWWDRFKRPIEARFRTDPVMIQTYLGYTNGDIMLVRGRVLEDEGIRPASETDSLWRNLVNVYRRFATDEIAYANLSIRAGSDDEATVIQATTDQEGYFTVRLPIYAALPATQSHWPVPVTLQSPPAEAICDIIAPANDAQFGIISDLDDTVLRSDALHIPRLIFNTVFKNAYTRLPFEGVGAFYRALQAGTTDTRNPLFYVSSSPWNLYDFIMEFFNVHDIPAGPIFLQDLGINRQQIGFQSHAGHKRRQIDAILQDFSHLPFILIGDSGQHDPEIYTQVIADCPDRIAAVYIRDVASAVDTPRMHRLMREASAHDVDLILVESTVAAARHAHANDFISTAAFNRLAGVP